MHFNYCAFICSCLLFFQLSASFTFAQVVDTTHYVKKNVLYKQTEEAKLTLDLYYPESYSSGELLPTAIFYFGGGWVGGNRNHFAPHCKYLASRGMLAVTADYRIFSKHGTSPQQAVFDARSAMRYLKENANTLGVDTSRLVAGGGSAGGHLALGTATLHDFNGSSDNLTVSPVPKALLLYNPVVNTTSTGYGSSKVGSDTIKLSPYHQIKSDVPPMLLFHGSDDRTVPLENIEQLNRKLDELLVSHTFYTYPGQGHGFFNLGRENDKYFIETLYQTDTFLQSLGYLTGVATFKSNFKP